MTVITLFVFLAIMYKREKLFFEEGNAERLASMHVSMLLCGKAGEEKVDGSKKRISRGMDILCRLL